MNRDTTVAGASSGPMCTRSCLLCCGGYPLFYVQRVFVQDWTEFKLGTERVEICVIGRYWEGPARIRQWFWDTF